MRLKVLLLAGAAIWCCTVQSQDSELKVRPAYFDPAQIRFEPFSPIDWESAARDNFHAFDLRHPNPQQLREKWSEITSSAEFSYAAPLPSATTTSHYYLLAEIGVVELRPQHLLGKISYAMDTATAKAPSVPLLDGEVSAVSAANAPLADAGFTISLNAASSFAVSNVLVSSAPSMPGISEHKEGKEVVYVYRDGNGQESTLQHENMETPGIRRAYLVKFSASPFSYLFVRWTPDASNCEFKYSLYKVANRLTKVAENFYGCDV